MVSMWFALHFVVQEVVGCEFPIQSSLQKQELLGRIAARTRGGTALNGVATNTLGSRIPSNTAIDMAATVAGCCRVYPYTSRLHRPHYHHHTMV